jgi:polysaccharide biosynthesis protein PslH
VPDVRPYLGEGSAFVVPLRIGGGTRLKIYEAMAMECPVVSTTVGAEGLPVYHNEHLLIADTEADFAVRCIELLDDVTRATAMADRAARLVRDNFGWPAVADHFVASCRAAAPAMRADASLPEPQGSI